MYLSVQLAARRLGVSSHTIRRWTASGVLPCIRTAGGHRRIKQEDVDELARAVAGAGGDQLAARLAREREVETLVETSIALTSCLDLTELLGEIARRLTAILECHFCAVSDYDDETNMVRVLADFDRQGRRVTDWKPYSLKKFPFSMRLMESQELAVITVSDPWADPAAPRQGSALRRSRGSWALGVHRQCGRPRLEQREDTVEAHHGEDVRHGFVIADDRKRALRRLFGAADENAEAAGIYEGRPRQVNDDLPRCLSDTAEKERLELRRRVDIDRTFDSHDDYVFSGSRDFGAELWIGLHGGTPFGRYLRHDHTVCSGLLERDGPL